MIITDKISGDLKAAMKAKDAVSLSALRMLVAALKNKKIELGNKEDLSDDQAVSVVKSEIKKRRDSIAAYKEGKRPDLAQKEADEIAILEKYLPPPMSETEVEKEIEAVIAEMGGDAGPRDFGRLMGAAMKKLGGRADGNTVSAALKKILNG